MHSPLLGYLAGILLECVILLLIAYELTGIL